MAIPRNLANLANQLDANGNPPKVQVGDTSVTVTDTGSNGTISFTTDNTVKATIDNAGNLTINGQGDLRLADADSSNYVALQAPATVASNVTWTLPNADGTTGQVLSTNGSGTLSWVAAGGSSNSISQLDSNVTVTDTGSNGTIAFTTDNSERMRVTSAGNVGIGVTPSAWSLTALQVSYAGLRGTAAAIGTSVNCYYDGAWKYISNGYASDNYQQDGDIVWRNTTSGTAGGTITWTERARIPAAGGFQCVNSISVGNATPTTSGAGITFPATQSASSNANTLDDYEEGTWTPANSVTTLTLNSAMYTKIGRLVCLEFDFSLATNASGSPIEITGVPFTSSSTGPFYGVMMSDNFNILNAFPYINAGTATMYFQFSSTTGGGRDSLAYSRIVSGGVIRGTLYYFV